MFKVGSQLARLLEVVLLLMVCSEVEGGNGKVVSF